MKLVDELHYFVIRDSVVRSSIIVINNLVCTVAKTIVVVVIVVHVIEHRCGIFAVGMGLFIF